MDYYYIVFGHIISDCVIKKNNCNHFAPTRHVQLQLLPGQAGPGGEGQAAQTEGQELQLLHEDLSILFIPHPVAHHRQPGALPHLRTARENCGGAKGQGQRMSKSQVFFTKNDASEEKCDENS